MRHLSLSLLFLASALAGCLAPRTRPAELPGPDSAPAATERALATTLGSGDLVEVRVFQEQDLSGIWRVAPDGTIDYPLCGKVKLLELDASGAADALTTCLREGFLRRPQVSVLVREFNSKKVFVFGEVQKPGTFPYEDNMSIIHALTLAGGFTKVAAKNGINVTRLVDGQERKIRVPAEEIAQGQTKNFTLLPGDIVFVPESFF